MAVTKILCFTLFVSLASAARLDMMDLFNHMGTTITTDSPQKSSNYPVRRYKQENHLSKRPGYSELEIFEPQPRYGYKNFLPGGVESGPSYEREQFINDLAVPVTAQPSSVKCAHDNDDVEFTPIGNVQNDQQKFLRITGTQEDEVIERERREETDIDIIGSAVEDNINDEIGSPVEDFIEMSSNDDPNVSNIELFSLGKDNTDPDAFNMELSSLREAGGSKIKGIKEERPNNQDGNIGIIRNDDVDREVISGRQLEKCEVQKNNNLFDFSCGCDQALGHERPIGNLKLNHTSCNSGLSVIWSELESNLSPQSITFVGVTLTLTNQTVNENSKSTVKKLTLIGSSLFNLPMDAFKGLKELEELRFFEVRIVEIFENAVRNHNKLKTFEIIQSQIGHIYQNAFMNLPAIVDFAISQSTLKDIKNLGINLNKTGESTSCGLGRSSRHTMREVVRGNEVLGRQIQGRQIQGADNINLPEFGSRFLLYQNNIQSLRTNAIISNAFGFLILAGNNISKIEPQAFDMQLHNPCEISAALVVSNNIETLSNQSFAGVRNKMNSNNVTFIALNNNTFGSVQIEGFQIEESMTIFSVDENKFQCDCKYMYWFLKDQESSNSFQTELKKQIIAKAKCTTGEDLTTFTSSCEDLPVTFTPKRPQTFMPSTYNSQPTPQPGLTSMTPNSAMSHSNLVNVFVIFSIFILINLHTKLLY